MIQVSSIPVTVAGIPSLVWDDMIQRPIVDSLGYRVDNSALAGQVRVKTTTSGIAEALSYLTAIYGGGEVFINAGTYKHNGFTVAEHTRLRTAKGVTLTGTGTINIGNTAANCYDVEVDLAYVNQGSGMTGDLVHIYNLGNCRVRILGLSGSAYSHDFIHVYSTNGLGCFDNWFDFETPISGCLNGLTLECGSNADSIASVSGDFVNGNSIYGALACSNNGIQIWALGQYSGSVNGAMQNNSFYRMDINSFTNVGIINMSAGRFSKNLFYDVTLEGTSPVNSVDLQTNAITPLAPNYWFKGGFDPSTAKFGTIDVINGMATFPIAFIVSGTPTPPTGTGSSHKITNTSGYTWRIYQANASGTHIIDQNGR